MLQNGKKNMEEAYDIARTKASLTVKENKDLFNKKARHSVLQKRERKRRPRKAKVTLGKMCLSCYRAERRRTCICP